MHWRVSQCTAKNIRCMTGYNVRWLQCALACLHGTEFSENTREVGMWNHKSFRDSHLHR